MWPFRKRHPDLSQLDTMREAWSVAKGEFDAAPLIVRMNTGCSDWVGHPNLPIKLAFAIPLKKQMPGGLPDPTENEELAAIEDRIAEETKSATRSIFAITLTNGTMKEFVFYISDGSVVEALHRGLQGSIQSHEVQCMATIEKDWQTYRRFRKG